MKKNLRIKTVNSSLILVISMALLSISSCKKEDDAPSVTPQANELNVKLDGQTWTGDILSWAKSGGTRQINATAPNSSIQIFMPEDTTGTFNALDNVVTVSYYDGTNTWSNNLSGEVRITANSDDHVEGEFDVVVASYFNSDTLTFTEGTFYFKDE